MKCLKLTQKIFQVSAIFLKKKVINNNPDSIPPKPLYMKDEYMKLYEENSNLKYKVLKLSDQIMVLQESLGSSYKANMQKYVKS